MFYLKIQQNYYPSYLDAQDKFINKLINNYNLSCSKF